MARPVNVVVPAYDPPEVIRACLECPYQTCVLNKTDTCARRNRAMAEWRRSTNRVIATFCTQCGRKTKLTSDPNGVCAICRERAARAASTCISCGAKTDQTKLCPECLVRRLKMVRARWVPRAPKEMIALRQSLGICIFCGKASAASGIVRCGPCADKFNAQRKKYDEREKRKK